MKGDPARDFWQAFSAEAITLSVRMAAGNLREVFERVASLLEVHGFEFCFELTEDGSQAVFALTPEGDPEQARCIDHLVEVKPEIPGWRVHGRRQRKPLLDAFAFIRHIYGLDVSDATFDIRETPKGFEVTMCLKAVESLTNEEALGLASTFLDHAVGEGVVMARVVSIDAHEGCGHLSPADLVETLVGR